MLLPLDDESRARLVRLAVLLCGSALLLAPLAGRGSIEIAQEQAAFGAILATPRLPAGASSADVLVERDPFAPLASSGALSATAGAAAASPSPQDAGVTVEAIVTGKTARALVDDSGQTRIVGIGDALGGSRIVRIDSGAVTLASGLSFALQTPGMQR